VSAFRNSDGSIAVVVLNSAHSRQTTTFSLRGLDAAHVTPYLTDTTHQLSAQTPITVRNNAFTTTLPPRSLSATTSDHEDRSPAVSSAAARAQAGRPPWVGHRCDEGAESICNEPSHTRLADSVGAAGHRRNSGSCSAHC
jgi:glycosyl hydrolase family 30